MAGHQEALSPAPPARRLALLAGALALAVLGGACRRGEFRLSGAVTIASALQRRAPRDNAVLFVIARNHGGVPVAVQRIVNPQFPVKFTLRTEDLLMPDLPPGAPLDVTVEMNTHGRLGQPQKGDLMGRYPSTAYPGDWRVHIVIDTQL
ncbi:MAG: hypothetical protein HY926_05505 [Elusimicrobia bacterium]|nr:hypothetical protein [Elusimicrobiota bacterium]